MTSFLLSLDASLQAGLARTRELEASCQPVRLRELDEKLRKSREGLTFDPVDRDRFDEAMVRLLEQGVEALSNFEHITLAYNLAKPSPKLDSVSLLNSDAALLELLRHWRERLRKAPKQRQIWRGSLSSYFSGTRADRRLDTLRQFLVDTLPYIKVGDRTPDWLTVIDAHPSLLKANPAMPYAEARLSGTGDRIDELEELVRVPKQSWFWDDFAEAVVKACCDTTDAIFDERRSIALSLIPGDEDKATDLGRRRDFILTTVVDRYANKALSSRDETLLAVVLGAWGSPQLGYDGKGHRWSLVSQAARDMVCGWVAEEDLVDFAQICRGDPDVDDRRLNYWLRFKKQISFSRIAIGSGVANDTAPKVKAFIGRKKDRLSHLHGAPRNNAIILRIGDWWFVEFSEKGNACHPYRADVWKLDVTAPAHLLYSLKNKPAVAASGVRTMPHKASRWELDFDADLFKLGIRPDGMLSSQPASPIRQLPSSTPLPHVAPPAPVVKKAPPAARPAESVTSRLGLPKTLENHFDALAPSIVDNRPKGGKLWIEIHRKPNETLRRAMETHGYRYAPSRGFYK